MRLEAHKTSVVAIEEPVERAVVRLALPAVGEQVLNASVAIIDTYLVGHLGAVELTGVGLANQYVLTATALFSATAVGCTALIARSIGARDHTTAQRGLGQSILLALTVGVLIAVLAGVFAPQLMGFVNATPDVEGYGALFIRVTAWAMPLTALLFMGNACLRGAGNTATPLHVMMLVNAVNIVVAWTLVNGIGPIPALGVLGVAIGAAVARGLGGLVVFGLLLRGYGGLRLLPALILPDWSVMRRILRIGIPSAIETSVMRVGQLSFAGVIASLGTVAYAAHVIVLNSESLSFMPGLGFSMAATTVVGQNLGAQRPDRAMRGAYYAFALGAGLMSLMGVALALFPVFFIGFFTGDPAVREMGTPLMRIAAMLQPGIAATLIFAGALRGAGDTRWPLLFNGLGIWVVRVLGGYIVVHLLGGTLFHVWLLLLIDFSVRGFSAFWRFRGGRWQTTKV